jgi:hypothetical protein
MLFGDNEFLKKYPYFLPCAVSATFAALALLLTFRFMKETVPDPQSFCHTVRMGVDRCTRSDRDEAWQSAEDINRKPSPPLRNILTSRVVIAVASYGCIALVDNAFSATWPLFFSTPIELGGLGMPISTIGKIFSISGILNGVVQMLFFAQVHDYWGSKTVCRAGIALMFPAIAAFPLMNHIAKTEGLNMTVWFLIALQIVLVTGVPFLYGTRILSFYRWVTPNSGHLRSNLYLYWGGITKSNISRCYIWVEPGMSSRHVRCLVTNACNRLSVT